MSSSSDNTNVTETNNLSPQLYKFVFLITGFMLFIWFIKTLIRIRSLIDLYQALQRGNIVRLDGLRQFGHITRDYLYQILRSRSTFVAKNAEKIIMGAHLLKINQKGGDNDTNVSIQLTVQTAAGIPAKIDAFIGVPLSIIDMMMTQYNKFQTRPSARRKKGKAGGEKTVNVGGKSDKKAFIQLPSLSNDQSLDERKKTEGGIKLYPCNDIDTLLAEDEYACKASTVIVEGGSGNYTIELIIRKDVLSALLTEIAAIPLIIHCSSSASFSSLPPSSSTVMEAVSTLPEHERLLNTPTIVPNNNNRHSEKLEAKERESKTIELMPMKNNQTSMKQVTMEASEISFINFLSPTLPITMKIDRQFAITNQRIVEIHELFGMTDESMECIVCLTEPKDIILLPCKHVCICSLCHSNVSKCPICRSAILSFMKFQADHNNPNKGLV